MRKKSLLILFLILFLIGSILTSILFYLLYSPNFLDSKTIYTIEDDQKQIQTFKVILDQKDADIIYSNLKEVTRNWPILSKHVKAHLFGIALYQSQKERGISVCDSDLSYGCIHGFFVEAILTQGSSIVTQLNEHCKNIKDDPYKACEHGIGHGLVEYFGHKQIPKALSQCELIQKNLFLGCSSGVFMEYFSPSPLSRDNNSLISINPQDPFKVCLDLPEKFISPCIFAVPELWKKTGYKFDKMADWCKNLKEAEYFKSCFRGLGYSTGNPSSLSPLSSFNLCSNSPNKTANLYCLAGATWFYKTLLKPENLDKTAGQLCQKSGDPTKCKKLSQMELDLM